MTEKTRNAEEVTSSVGKALWVYGYEMIPPHPEDRMEAIRALLDRQNNMADQEARTWKARLITESHATHVLIVSNTREIDLEVHQNLEAELRALGVKFRLTGPISVADGNGDGDGDEAEPGDGVEPGGS